MFHKIFIFIFRREFWNLLSQPNSDFYGNYIMKVEESCILMTQHPSTLSSILIPEYNLISCLMTCFIFFCYLSLFQVDEFISVAASHNSPTAGFADISLLSFVHNINIVIYYLILFVCLILYWYLFMCYIYLFQSHANSYEILYQERYFVL